MVYRQGGPARGEARQIFATKACKGSINSHSGPKRSHLVHGVRWSEQLDADRIANKR
jgi:hypothetical protein